jgi:2-phosphoglycerate kinase
MNPFYSWNILLISGHSTSGKSTVAHKLGRHLAVPVLQADDIRLALQRATMPGQIDGLHFFRDPNAIRSADPDDLVTQLICIGEIVSDAIEAVIAHHVVTRTPIIIEGDGILPKLVTQTACDDAQVAGRMRAVFVIEPDEARFKDACENRWPGVTESEDAWRWRRLAWKYGQWLEQEARRLGLPVVASRPFESLVDRVAAALQL